MFGMVSTKDLYLVMLQQVRRIEQKGHYTNIYYNDDKLYAFAYKKTVKDYVDFFTGTEYCRWDSYFVVEGQYVVRTAKPIITEKKQISVSFLKQQLNELNAESVTALSKSKVKVMSNPQKN